MEYHFVNADVYCPWDVINYVDLLKAAQKAKPQAFLISQGVNISFTPLLYTENPRLGRGFNQGYAYRS